MIDIFTQIQSNEQTFNDFRKWLFVKLGNNKDNFLKFGKYPNTFKIPYLLKYLESKEVHILSALCYYDALSSNQASDFDNLCTFLIIQEFKRLEQKRIIDYVPF